MSDEKKDKIEGNRENQKVARKEEPEVGEDSTKYGEFISSYFAWVGLDKQKEIVNRLENMTNKNHQ